MAGVKVEPSAAPKFYSKFTNLLEEWEKIRIPPIPLDFLRSDMTDQNPIQSLVVIAEYADSFFTPQLAMNFKHSGKSEQQIISYYTGRQVRRECIARAGYLE